MTTTITTTTTTTPSSSGANFINVGERTNVTGSAKFRKLIEVSGLRPMVVAAGDLADDCLLPLGRRWLKAG